MKSKRIVFFGTPFMFLVLASTALAGLPDPGMRVDSKTAFVITDPLFKTAKAHGMPVFISPVTRNT